MSICPFVFLSVGLSSSIMTAKKSGIVTLSSKRVTYKYRRPKWYKQRHQQLQKAWMSSTSPFVRFSKKKEQFHNNCISALYAFLITSFVFYLRIIIAQSQGFFSIVYLLSLMSSEKPISCSTGSISKNNALLYHRKIMGLSRTISLYL